MKNTTSLTTESGLSAIKFTFGLFMIVAVIDYIISYAIAKFLSTEAIQAELTKGSETLTKDAVTYMAAISLSGLVIMIAAIICLVITYKKSFKYLGQENIDPRHHANKTALIVTASALVASFLSTVASLTYPTMDVKAATELSIANGVATAVSVLFFVVLYFVLRHFAYKKATKQNEELFS